MGILSIIGKKRRMFQPESVSWYGNDRPELLRKHKGGMI